MTLPGLHLERAEDLLRDAEKAADRAEQARRGKRVDSTFDAFLVLTEKLGALSREHEQFRGASGLHLFRIQAFAAASQMIRTRWISLRGWLAAQLRGQSELPLGTFAGVLAGCTLFQR